MIGACIVPSNFDSSSSREGMVASEDEIREFCRGQIAHYKVPHYVRFVDSFPLTVTGKVQKYLIREKVTAELHLVAEAHA